MAGKVFFSVAMTLDGFIAPASGPEDIDALRSGTTTPRLKRWMAQWMELQHWAFKQRFFRENLKLGGGGEEGVGETILQYVDAGLVDDFTITLAPVLSGRASGSSTESRPTAWS